MTSTRRQFIKQFGVALASLVAARCAPATSTSTATPVPIITPTITPTPTATPTATPTLTPPRGGDISLRDRLRDCWLRLDWVTQEVQEDLGRGTARDELIADHQAVLDELVAAGELDADVAEQVQIAFDAAAYRAWFTGYRRYVNICYTPTPSPMPDHTPEPYEMPGYALADYMHTSASQLVQRANLLAEMAEGGDLAPDVVTLAQAALERDITFLSIFNEETQAGLERVIGPSRLSNEESWALYDVFGEAVSDPHNLPNFNDLELEITPEAAEAARFLVELLVGKTE